VTIASGKGGTGKTTVAVNLALTAAGGVQLLDCDVEEPNCHLFLDPDIRERRAVGIPVPVVDEAKCTACGECGRACQYHAIVSLKTIPLVFPDLCHGCGGCAKACPTGAITEVDHVIGVVEAGDTGSVALVQGRLNVGVPSAAPLIRAVRHRALGDRPVVIDCPPGTSCPMIAATRGSDYVILVTEPTPFGLNDLTLAVETMRELGIRFGVLLNRADSGDGRVLEYCRRESIRVLLEVPDDRRVAEAYSRGRAAVTAMPEYRQVYQRLWDDIEEEARTRAAGGLVHADG
jgi:MinD superfamily P-loop ATPase